MKAHISKGKIRNILPDNVKIEAPDELIQIEEIDFEHDKNSLLGVVEPNTYYMDGTTLKKYTQEEIEATPEYQAKIKAERKKAYEEEVDPSNFELLEKICEAIKEERIVINGQETKDLATFILLKKDEIRTRIK